MNKRKLTKQKGQAIIEYVLLLSIILLSATAFLGLDATLKDKLIQVAHDLKGDDQSIPIVVEKDTLIGARLSPPVADFTVPTPNYKGRSVHFIDRSFDTDGVVEHYYWTISGNGINDQKSYDKFNEPVKGGMEYTFRYAGTYTVSLIVVDNDGLVSNKATYTVTILDRSPTLSMTVTSHLGTTANMSSSVNVWQGCTATFRTTYDDPDLPYEVLTLYSTFTDFAGTVQTFTTVPNEFERKFYNLGTHKYYVRVTDENGMMVSGTVSVNVIANPNGFNGDASACTTVAVTGTPVFKIKVDGSASSSGNVYTFKTGTTATITGQILPDASGKTYTLHTEPVYWNPSDWTNPGLWKSLAEWQVIYRPITTPDGKWDSTTPDVKLCGMVRTNQYLETTPTPNLPNKTSNEDCVILKTTPDAMGQKPVITVNDEYWTTTTGVNMTVNVRKTDLANNVIAEGKFKGEVQSNTSYVIEGGVKSATKKIDGVRWAVPVDQEGNTDMRPDPVKYPEDKNSDIFQATDDQGYTLWWYRGMQPAPGTKNGKIFVYGEGSGALKNTWTYELRTIIKDTSTTWQASKQSDTAKKVITLKKENKPPVAVCTYAGSNTRAEINVGETLTSTQLSAKKSSDPDGDDINAWWQKQGDSGYIYKDITGVPAYSWDAEGDYIVYLVVEDPMKLQSDKIECNVHVSKKDPNQTLPITPEFWDIQYRVGDKTDPIIVKNKSTDTSKNIGYTIFSNYYKSGWGQYSTWAANTSLDSDGNREDEKAVDCRGDSSRKSCNETNQTFSMKYYGAVVVTIYTTNDDLTANCSNAAYTWSRNSKVGSGVFCKKSAPYFRTTSFKIRDYSTGGQCTIQSIDQNVQQYSIYNTIFSGLAAEENTVFNTRDGRQSTIKNELTNLLICN